LVVQRWLAGQRIGGTRRRSEDTISRQPLDPPPSHDVIDCSEKTFPPIL
jgi:hypothetical protein